MPFANVETPLNFDTPKWQRPGTHLENKLEVVETWFEANEIEVLANGMPPKPVTSG